MLHQQSKYHTHDFTLNDCSLKNASQNPNRVTKVTYKNNMKNYE